MANIHILVGSVTGKAVSAAEAINTVFLAHQHHSLVFTSPSIEQVIDDGVDVLILVTSTCGKGDLPPSIAALHKELLNQYPVISNKRFAVVALGDSSYGTYCQGGAILEAQMIDLQAQALCERFNIDGYEHFIPIDEARQWALNCLPLI